jgi:hypothetical protein
VGEERATEGKVSTWIKNFDFDSPKAPPTVLGVGSILWKATAELANVDFILSVREERLAMMFQFLLDYGWMLLVFACLVWLLQAHRRPEKERVHWGMVISFSILSFMVGILVSVYATGSLPNVVQSWSGDWNTQICNATIDTSRLIGFKNGYRMVLVCGASDPKVDPQEDNRIAVSSAFHITGAPVLVVAPFGSLTEAVKQVPPNTGQGFMLWHAVALIPKDSDPAAIKRISDVYRQGGRVVTDPTAGGFANPIAIATTPTPTPPTVPVSPAIPTPPLQKK